jgi:hypothetical protein
MRTQTGLDKTPRITRTVAYTTEKLSDKGRQRLSPY